MRISKFILFSGIFIIVHILILVSTEFIDWPEMLLYPWLSENNFRLYVDLLVPYQPISIYLLRFFFNITGYSIISLKLIHLALIALIDLILLFVLLQTSNSYTASLAGLLLYIIWQPYLEGGGLWFDHFMLPSLLFGYYYTLRAITTNVTRDALCASVFLGLAFITKQTAFIALGPLLVLIIRYKVQNKNQVNINIIYKIILISLVFPLFQFLFYLYKGFGSKYLFWVYGFLLTLRKDPDYIIFPKIIDDLPMVLLLLLTIVIYLNLTFNNIRPKPYTIRFSFLWFIFSLVILYPRWTLTHFQSSLVFLVILFTQFLTIISSKKTAYKKVSLVCLLLIMLITIRINYSYTKKNIRKLPRFYNPQSKKTIQQIQNIKKDKSFFFFGNTEYLYVYINEKPYIKPYIQLFPWNTRVYGIQESLLKEIKKNEIEYIFFSPYHPNNVFYNGESPEKLVNYINNYYKKVSVISPNISVFIRKNFNTY